MPGSDDDGDPSEVVYNAGVNSDAIPNDDNSINITNDDINEVVQGGNSSISTSRTDDEAQTAKIDESSPNVPQEGGTPEHHERKEEEAEEESSNDLNDDDKSRTFRKRRLTFTQSQVARAAMEVAAAAVAALDAEDEKEGDEDQSHHSIKDNGSGNAEDSHLVAVAADRNSKRRSRSYRHPRTASTNLFEEKQAIIDPEATTHQFPSNIVGWVSCHGIEPLYDDHYEEGEEDLCHDEEEGAADWAIADQEQHRVRETTTVAKRNQDAAGVTFPLHLGGSRISDSNAATSNRKGYRQALFAVYDGHGQGGEWVSNYALHHIPRLLEEKDESERSIADVEQAFCHAMEQVSSDLGLVAEDESREIEENEGEQGVDPMFAGTTACCILIQSSSTATTLDDGNGTKTSCNHASLWVANVGDSRAILGKRRRRRQQEEQQTDDEIETTDLSQDQNPDLLEERTRIEAAGGYVTDPPSPGLSARVWLDPEHSQVGLAMARSIGDYACKSVGVIATPVVTKHEVVTSVVSDGTNSKNGKNDTDNEQHILVLASDGVWEFMSSDEVMKLVVSELDATSDDATKACQALLEEASARWKREEGDYRDDITAMVILLDQLLPWMQSTTSLSSLIAATESKKHTLEGEEEGGESDHGSTPAFKRQRRE